MDAVNSMLRDRDDVASDSSMQDSGGEEDHWNGIQDEPVVDHEDEYTDEGRFTTVTVEAVDVSRDGLRKAIQDGIEEKEDSGPDLPNTSPGRASQQGSVGQEKAKRIWTKEPPSGLKKKKKKFRYESKAERKITRHKERSGNKSKAKARRE